MSERSEGHESMPGLVSVMGTDGPCGHNGGKAE
jgi:hypothetical protein